jgi:hypothetical protein
MCACSRQRTAVPEAAPAPTIDAGAPDASETESSVASIDSGPSAMRAEDWEIAAGKWSFEDGEASCDCASGSMMFWKRDRPKDFDASIDVRFGVIESSAGLVFREQSGTFYQLEWYTRGTHHDRRLSLMVKNPYWVQIVTPIEREPPLDQWITLRVRARGDRLETWVNGESVFEKTDTSYVRAGRIGVQVFQPRKVRFAHFRITPLD